MAQATPNNKDPGNMSLRLCCRSEAFASDLQQSLRDMFTGETFIQDFLDTTCIVKLE